MITDAFPPHLRTAILQGAQDRLRVPARLRRQDLLRQAMSGPRPQVAPDPRRQRGRQETTQGCASGARGGPDAKVRARREGCEGGRGGAIEAREGVQDR